MPGRYWYGRSLSLEHRAKIGVALRGNQNALGYKHNAETCDQMSAAKMGNQNTRGHSLSLEHRAKIGAANKGNQNSLGRHLSIEVKAKISAAHKGKTLSPEHRAKLAIAATGGPSKLGWKMIDFLSNVGFEVICPEESFGPYRVDALLAEEWVAFEADEAYHKRIKELDTIRDEYLLQNFDLPVVRLTKEDLNGGEPYDAEPSD